MQGVLQHMTACYPGLLLQSELRYLHSTFHTPDRCAVGLLYRRCFVVVSFKQSVAMRGLHGRGDVQLGGGCRARPVLGLHHKSRHKYM